MRLYLLIMLLALPIFSNAQDRDVDRSNSAFKTSNSKRTDVERLRFLDSLASQIRYDTPFNNDSIFRVTIKHAQKIDSIHIALKHIINFINYLNYGPNDYVEAKKIIKSAYPLLPLVTKPNMLDDFYFEAAHVYFDSRNFDVAITLFDSAYTYAKKYNSNFIERSLMGSGMAHIQNGNFGEASLEIQKAALLFRAKKDTLSWLDTKNSMSIIYSKNGFFEEAKKERNEMIDIANVSNSYPNIALIYYNNASDDNKSNLQTSRIQNLKKALAASVLSINRAYFESPIKSELVAALAENDSVAQADILMTELEAEDHQITGFNRPFYLNAKMRLALAKQDYANALSKGIDHYELKTQGDQYEEIQEAELFLSEVYELLGHTDKAYLHFKNYTKIKDSIGSLQKTRLLAYYQTLYETEKRDLTILNQQSNIALLDSKNRVKKQWLVFGGTGLLVIFGFFTMIRSKNYTKKKQKSQEIFTQNIIDAQEQERTRLAMELHDSVGQQLMLLTRKIKNTDNKVLETLANDTLSNLRTISQGLYPAALERLGFTEAIENLVTELDEATPLFFTLEIEDIDQLITKNTALHMYRILQEALTNTLKHADAKAVFISIKKASDHIVMTIKDNGKGFDYDKALHTSKSLGMKSLIERCKIIKAKLEVESVLEKGTQIVIKPVIVNYSLPI